MKLIRLLLFLSSLTFIYSYDSPALCVEAKLLKKFKVELVDEEGYLEFLKFETLENNQIFLLSPDNKTYTMSYFKKYRTYKISYFEGALLSESELKTMLSPNSDLKIYPFHFLHEAERIK